MLPDIKIKDFYMQFVHDTKADIIEYNKCLDTILKLKKETYDYIEEHKEDIKDTFNINLDKIKTEWQDKKYNNKKYLYNLAIVLIRNNQDHPKRVLLLQIAKYCNLLHNEYSYNLRIKLAEERKNLKMSTYKKYVYDYYTKVHKCVLQGMGYKYGYDIGTYVINHWKLDTNSSKSKPRIDYAATNAKKKELIAKGIKPYDEKEAAWYEARHIPYAAVDYRVYKNITDWYEFTFINSRIFGKNKLEYKKTEYVAAKYRGMTYKQMADELCELEETVYNLQVDIRYKLNIILYKDPTKYLNFVRNAEQNKYKS